MTQHTSDHGAHTPGPWRVVRTRNGNDRMTAVGNGDYGSVATTAGHRPSDDENEANARLIAAAPMLLEALEKLVAECGSLQIAAIREVLGNTNAAVFNLRAQEARAAIRAAKGESNDS